MSTARRVAFTVVSCLCFLLPARVVRAADVCVAFTLIQRTSGDSIWHPAFYRNGSLVFHEGGNAVVRAAAVVGGSVYLAGSVRRAWGAEEAAAYWVDGRLVRLADDTARSVATALTVAGSDVWCAGFMNDAAGTRRSAVLWKNGQPTLLAGRGSDSVATAISVAGPDVYVAGFDLAPATGVAMAVYWKNGSRVDVTDGSAWSMATSIAVSGSDVYVTVLGVNAGVGKAWYYRNGTPVAVPGSFGTCTARSVVVQDQDVWVLGTDGTRGAYWRNGEEHFLKDSEGTRRYAGLAVIEGTPYSAGLTPDGHAVYWKAEDRQSLPLPGSPYDVVGPLAIAVQ
ncbi:MAG TPA: hypothetical protein VMF68_15040 [Spirochaetia bacterium]|nr:hypothetical protein [Spirochaetia bacterium]